MPTNAPRPAPLDASGHDCPALLDASGHDRPALLDASGQDCPDVPFSLIEPKGDDSPVLVEVPHAGVGVDAESAAWIAAPIRSMARDADPYVHELFADSPSSGATLLFARTSRYVVDLNRAEDDYDGATVAGGPAVDRPRGVIWRLTSDGLPVQCDRLPREEYQRRIELLHRPYHETIERVLHRKRARFGFAFLLCAHSMPTPRTRGVDVVVPGPGHDADLVPGTRGRTTAADHWIELIDRIGRARGWKVQHDMPYKGGFSTAQYGRPAAGWHAAQIEIARRLYMDERTLARDPTGFARVRAFARELVSSLVDAALAHTHDQAGE